MRNRAQVILLGASNVIRGLPVLLRLAARALGGATDVRAAVGHGRSYGVRSTVFGRDLPGIIDCGLWGPWEGTGGETCALVADIGNDLAYGFSSDQVLGWIEECVEKLARRNARIVMLQMPLVSLRKLTERQFWFLSRVQFGRHAISRDEALARTERVAVGVEEMARRYGATLVEQKAEWYGFDPIHIRPLRWRSAWGEIVEAWGRAAPLTARTVGVPFALARFLPPERRWVLGRELHWQQPVAKLPDGSWLWMH